MSVQGERFNPSTDGHQLDRLRHTSNRVNRMLRGAGSRAKQWEVLRREGIVGVSVVESETTSAPQLRQINFNGVTQNVFDRFKALVDKEKLTRLELFGYMLDLYERRGEKQPVAENSEAAKQGREQWERLKLHAQVANKSATVFLRDLLNDYEQPVARVTAITTDAANVLASVAGKIGAKTHLEAVNILIASHEARNRANERIRELENELKSTGHSLENQAATIQDQRDALAVQQATIERAKGEIAERERRLAERPAQAVDAALPQEGLQEVAFGLVEALTGTTATLDSSGEIVVIPPDGAMVKLFDVWRSATKLLGFGKK